MKKSTLNPNIFVNNIIDHNKHKEVLLDYFSKQPTKINGISNSDWSKSEDMSRSYNHMMINYEKSEPLAKKEKPATFKRERLSDEDNDRVNEIFDEFEDDEFIPKKTLH